MVDLYSQPVAMCLGQPRRPAWYLAVAQTIRPLDIEPDHPVPHNLQFEMAQPRRLRARAAVVDRFKSQKSPGLSRLLAVPRQAAKGGQHRNQYEGVSRAAW